MLLGNKLVFYLGSKTLRILNPRYVSELNFPEGVFQYQDAGSGKKNEQLIEDFLNKINLKNQQVIVLLDKEAVYEGTVVLENTKEAENELQKFISKIPYKEDDLAVLKLYEDKILTLIAISKDSYQPLRRICNNLGWKVEAVIPLPALGEGLDKKTLNWKDVEQLFGKINSFKKFNFIKEKVSVIEKKKTHTVNYKLIGVGITILLVFIGLSGFFLLSSQKPIIPKRQDSVPQVVQPESSISSKLVTVSQENLKISIVNASGIAGQAGKIKNQLESQGFKNIETGNAAKKEDGDSTIQFGPNVPADLAKQIVDVTKKNAGDVVEESTKSAVFDVAILTKK